jgi:PadR family transcriptional regulator, regulatory protein PadR
MSKQTLTLLALMLSDPELEWYGLRLSKVTGIAPGTLYPILHRLERADWLDAYTEDIDPSKEKRPARRVYRLSRIGEHAARQRLQQSAPQTLRTLSIQPGLA